MPNMIGKQIFIRKFILISKYLGFNIWLNSKRASPRVQSTSSLISAKMIPLDSTKFKLKLKIYLVNSFCDFKISFESHQNKYEAKALLFLNGIN